MQRKEEVSQSDNSKPQEKNTTCKQKILNSNPTTNTKRNDVTPNIEQPPQKRKQTI